MWVRPGSSASAGLEARAQEILQPGLSRSFSHPSACVPPGLYSLDAGVAGRAEALARAGVAAGAVAALARQLAALAVGARRAELLAAPASEAGGAHAGARDGVAQGTVLALAPVAAMRAPVVAIAACKRGAGQDGRIPVDSPGWGLGPAFPSLHHSSLDRRQQGGSGAGEHSPITSISWSSTSTHLP